MALCAVSAFSCSKNIQVGSAFCDRAFVVTALTLSGLILGGVLRVPSCVGYTFLGLGTGVVCIDSITMLVKRSRDPLAPTNATAYTAAAQYQNMINEYRKEICQAKDPGIDRYQASVFCHNIIGNIWLGNIESFLGTVGQKMKRDPEKELEVNRVMFEKLSKKFSCIISASPLCEMKRHEGGSLADCEEGLKEKFYEQKIKWYYIGRSLLDREDAWHGLVYDCTARHTELFTSINIDSYHENEVDVLLQKKAFVIEAINVEDWFNPVFAVLDQALFGKETLLIHCYAGIMRSATVLVAYLINRFDVPAQSAIAYVRSKRGCIDTRFENELTEYAMHLREARTYRELSYAYFQENNDFDENGFGEKRV